MRRMVGNLFVGLTVAVLFLQCLWLRWQLTESDKIIKEYETLLSKYLEQTDKRGEKEE